MAGKPAVKKFLLSLCVFFVALATLGVWVGLSIERKQAGDLRSSVFDGVGPSWLRGHTFGNPEVPMSDLTDIDFEKFNTDTLKGKGFAYDEKTKLLTAKESQFKVQLKEGDLLKFFLHGDGETTEARVVKINSSIEVELNGAHHLHLHGDETVRLYRPFTGTEYRFYGEPGKAGVDTHYDTLKAPRDHYFTEEGILVEGSPPVQDDHGGGHGGGHGMGLSYVPNIRPGQFKDFYKNWPLGKYYRHVKYECQYKEGRKHGSEQYWQSNGHSNWKKTWKEDILGGPFEEWYSSGEKKLSAEYLDGKLHGVYITFHPNGEKSLKTHFEEGKLHGRYETWNAFKNRVYNLNYEYGSLKPKSTGGGSGH